MTTVDTQTSELVIPDVQALVVAFTAVDGVDPLLDKIEASARAEAPDVSTAKGRKAIASLAYKIAQSKSALDAAGKNLNAEKRAQIDAVDAARRKVRDRLDALKAEIRAPLDAWESEEAMRKDRLERALGMFDLGRVDSASDPDVIRRVLGEVSEVDTSTGWDEYQKRAEAMKSRATDKFFGDLIAAEKRVAQEEELARLRAAEAERQRREAEEAARREAEEAAARAKLEAEEHERQAKADADRRAKEEAERRAHVEQEKREVAERAAKAERERAERAAHEAEERHKREVEAAAKRERERIAEEKAAEEAARAKREADEKHRAAILADINAALMPIPREQIAYALMDGRIPHVRVSL